MGSWPIAMIVVKATLRVYQQVRSIRAKCPHTVAIDAVQARCVETDSSSCESDIEKNVCPSDGRSRDVAAMSAGHPVTSTHGCCAAWKRGGNSERE